MKALDKIIADFHKYQISLENKCKDKPECDIKCRYWQHCTFAEFISDCLELLRKY